ncbi:SgcJ/EcaC family oxidoreductase [Shewanella sp. D64]|uniref:YybH family protein n=1 Tax=unclassified Shewanella TaxID=196818 RepID=UPI0022BA5D8F|nr:MULTISPECIES: SgcJ/EcaC family oxidoreductase [unclassified Shewanella]MEC4726285.1 SgcJ/EcaC family oxidoreductase [Shewanella sp. D64]MEC4738297.1 SgcJ/EcaC family oxidoreductase [Shewanella sp. E94]WBJ95433.1 SgcJ/EcaC family oxidoreductase [Shewanella sp. MTB7]
MIRKGLVALLMLTAFSALAVPSDDIAQVIQEQESAWNRGDLDGYMQGYWNNDKMRFVSGDKFRYGWEDTLAAYKKNYPDKATLGTLKFTIKEIKMLSNYAAMVVGRWQLTRAKDQPGGVFTLLVEKIDDRWVITHDHTSD